MINILITGVGGQGTVLAAKMLASAAASHDWKVRTAETIGMSQRGGSVVSHVRIGNDGENVHAPLITPGCADLIIAFEPVEGARVLPYLSKNGLMVSATTQITPPGAALSGGGVTSKEALSSIRSSIEASRAKALNDGSQCHTAELAQIDDEAIVNALGGNPRILNTVLLAAAISLSDIPISIDDLKQAIRTCVKDAYVNMNLNAIDATLERISECK